MAQAYTIRRAVGDDVPVLHALLSELSREIGYEAAFRADADALRRHGFGARPLFRALIAGEAAGQADHALGIAVYFPEFSTQRGRPGVYLQDIYIRPEARSGGLGRRLIGAVVRDAADWQVAYLRLAAHAGNESALAFYDRLGFQSDPRERPLWVEGARLTELGEIR